ncbi:MAG: SH3 domain-containing protein [Chloroflexi bacterium]|nr:SH3 domain-containing protein [Chloroflexota bacterium]
MRRALLIVLLASLFAQASPAFAATQSKPFPQTGGFIVSNDGGVRFWDAFQRLGGEQIVGYPVSERFHHGGFITQVMQKAVFQWRPESGSVAFVNVFDDLATAGKDDWLLSVRSTPRPLEPGFDDGKEWQHIVRDRVALLNARPRMRAQYHAVPDPLLQYGLPTSRIQDMGNHYAIRLQRAVIQEWKVDVPWAKAGQTTVANGGDIMKEAGLIGNGRTEGTAAPVHQRPDDFVRVTVDMAIVRSGPHTYATEVARIFKNAQMQKRGDTTDGWTPVRIWNSLDGWVAAGAITRDAYPATDSSRSTGYRPAIPARPLPSIPLPVAATIRITRTEPLFGAPGGAAAGTVGQGTSARLIGYAAHGARIWIQIEADSRTGWVISEAAEVAARDPFLPGSDGRPIHGPATGKGMWATYDLLGRATPEQIIAAARANGITHIYLQVGRSNLGFYGGPGLDALLPVARAHGVAVIAWVYPFLNDVVADLNLTVQAANYRTPGGLMPDGVASDVEENMGIGAVHAYSHLTRALLGEDRLLVIATYPPQMALGRTYPFASVARVWNVIAPMDYYHRPESTYTEAQAAEYVADSIRMIRERAGRPVHIAPIGQAYGMKWPNEVGPTNPTFEETRGMLSGARAAGGVGLSFFEWSHATEAQWRAIGAFGW